MLVVRAKVEVVQTQGLTSWVNCAVLCCFCGLGVTMVGTRYLGGVGRSGVGKCTGAQVHNR